MIPTAQRRITAWQIAAWLGPKDRAFVLVCAAASFGVAVLRFGIAQAAICAVLGAVAAAITLIDLRHFRIPDLLSVPLIPLGLLAAHLADAPLAPRLWAMAVVWLLLTLMQRVFVALRGRSGLGSGDVKLMTAAAVWLDPSVLPAYVLAAAVTGLCDAWLRRAGFKARLAFGAHLAPWLAVFVLSA